jgi:hypothetical protein
VEAAIALRAAESIGSDHDRAELLLAVIEVVAIDDALAVPFMRVLDGIGSKSDHGRVASALLRQRGR